MSVTPDLLGRMVEQPEPSVDGNWYVLDLQGLLDAGYTAIGVHFDDGQRRANDVELHREEGADSHA